MSGGRTITASAIRIPASSISSPTRRPTSSASIFRRTPTRLLWVTDHCLRTYDRINVIVAGKQPAPQWLTMEEAATHCDAGIGIWTWAGTEDCRRRARRGDGLRRRRADAGDAGGGRSAAQGVAGAEDPRRQRRRPDDAAAEGAASAWPQPTATSTACSRATSR